MIFHRVLDPLTDVFLRHETSTQRPGIRVGEEGRHDIAHSDQGVLFTLKYSIQHNQDFERVAYYDDSQRIVVLIGMAHRSCTSSARQCEMG